jgi:nucleoside-diphosphate-sugar epimerase
VTSIVGIDLVEPDIPVAKVEFHRVDVRDRLLPVILGGAGMVVHCALQPAAERNDEAAFARTVHGSRNLLDAVAKVGARKLVVVSSAMVYGAHPDNELPLAEDVALRANPDFATAYHLRLVEQLVEE